MSVTGTEQRVYGIVIFTYPFTRFAFISNHGTSPWPPLPPNETSFQVIYGDSPDYVADTGMSGHTLGQAYARRLNYGLYHSNMIQTILFEDGGGGSFDAYIEYKYNTPTQLEVYAGTCGLHSWCNSLWYKNADGTWVYLTGGEVIMPTYHGFLNI